MKCEILERDDGLGVGVVDINPSHVTLVGAALFIHLFTLHIIKLNVPNI